MRWLLAAAAVVLAGCSSVKDLEQSPETMDVISGKTPKQFAECLQARLQDSRGTLEIQPDGNDIRVVVPQKLSSKPAAVIAIDERSNGSAIKLHERLSNFPLRFSDVKNATSGCISD